MDISQVIASSGGILHRSGLRQRGVTARHVRAAIDAGDVRTVGRSWVITRDCPIDVARAARLGGRLACVSAAKRLGLWTLDDARLHVSVPPGYSRVVRDAGHPPLLLHWANSAWDPSPVAAVEPLIDVLRHVARCQPVDRAVIIFDSAQNLRHINARELRIVSSTQSARFRQVAELSDGRADSGIESIIRLRLGWLGIEMRIQAWLNGHRVDGLIGERLVIQADGGGPHSEPAQRDRDLAEDAELIQLGYEVLRFSYRQIVDDWPWVEAKILNAVAQGMHLWGARPSGSAV